MQVQGRQLHRGCFLPCGIAEPPVSAPLPSGTVAALSASRGWPRNT